IRAGPAVPNKKTAEGSMSKAKSKSRAAKVQRPAGKPAAKPLKAAKAEAKTGKAAAAKPAPKPAAKVPAKPALKTTAKPALKAGAKAAAKTPSLAATNKSIMESAQHIWLAGLGAFAKAQGEGGKMFQSLIREGSDLEQKTRKIATGTVDDMRDAVESG